MTYVTSATLQDKCLTNQIIGLLTDLLSELPSDSPTE